MVGTVASWLVRSTPDRVIRVQGLAGDVVLCSWTRHFTLTVPLSTQVYKWVPAKCWGQPCDGLASHPGGSRNTPCRFMLMKPVMSAGLMRLLARISRDFTFYWKDTDLKNLGILPRGTSNLIPNQAKRTRNQISCKTYPGNWKMSNEWGK